MHTALWWDGLHDSEWEGGAGGMGFMTVSGRVGLEGWAS